MSKTRKILIYLNYSHAETSKNISFFFGLRATGDFFTAYFSGKLLEYM